jgi:hypothetical protein
MSECQRSKNKNGNSSALDDKAISFGIAINSPTTFWQGNVAVLNALSGVVLQHPNHKTIGCQDISSECWTVGIIGPRDMQ